MKSAARQFVVHEHSRQDQPTHWDLMLRNEGLLQTYRLELPPHRLADQATPAVRIFDHPLKFLTYEGSVNKGLGNVKIVDSGTYELLEDNSDFILLQFKGQTLQGQFQLTRQQAGKWQLRKTGN